MTIRKYTALLIVLFLISLPIAAQSAICANEYHSECIYSYLIDDTLNYKPNSSNERSLRLFRLGGALLEGGYPETARLVTLRALAEMYEVTPSTDIHPDQTTAIRLQLEKIDKAIKNSTPEIIRKQETEAEATAKVEMYVRQIAQYRTQDSSTRSSLAYGVAETLAETSLSYAQAGNFDKALNVAKKIGDEDFNSSFLLYPAKGQETRDFNNSLAYINSLSTVNVKYSASMHTLITYIKTMTDLAAQRYATEGSAPAIQYLDKVDKILARANNTEALPRMAIEERDGLAYLAHPNKHPAFSQIRFLILTGEINRAWKVYDAWPPPENVPYKAGYQMRIDSLRDFAHYYATHPDKAGADRVVSEILKFARETLPSCIETSAGCYPTATGGPVMIMHKTGLLALAQLNNPEAIKRIAVEANRYSDQPLKYRTRLYVATALAIMGRLADALPYAQEFLNWYKNHQSALKIDKQHNMGAQIPVSVTEDDLADFILTAVQASAPEEEKRTALAMSNALPRIYKETSYQLAIAKKRMFNDKDFSRNIALAIVPGHLSPIHNTRNIDILNAMVDAGYYDEAKPFLRDETILTQTPVNPHGNKPNYYAVYTQGLRADTPHKLVTIYAKAGDYAAAESISRAIFDFTNITKVGGTDLVIYSLRQRTLKSIGLEAARQGNESFVAALMKEGLQHPLLRSAVWYALARTALTTGREDAAHRFYEAGRSAAPDLAAMLVIPLNEITNDIGVLALRAELEHDLALDDDLQATEDMVKKLATYVAVLDTNNDPAKMAINLLSSQVRPLSKESANGRDIQSFISSLGVKADIYGREALRKAALDYLADGDNAKARAIGLYGLGEISERISMNDTKSVGDILLNYADIIAKTEKKNGSQFLENFEKNIRTHPNIIMNEYDLAFFRDKYGAAGVPPKPVPGQDYVEMGEKIIARLKDIPNVKLPPKQEGIDEAVKLGYLRRATAVDINEWEKIVRHNGKSEVAKLPLPRLLLENSAYVVLREFESPTGLGGAGAIIFIVPKGKYPPSGNIGHSVILDMNTLQCTGALCR